MNENEIAAIVIDCGLKVHRKLGPGLLENVYEECLYHKLNKTGLMIERQKILPIKYDEIELTNAAAQGLANVIATKKGNFVVASIFFGSFCAFMGWLFGDEFGALVGLVIGIYLAKLNNKMMFKDQ